MSLTTGDDLFWNLHGYNNLQYLLKHIVFTVCDKSSRTSPGSIITLLLEVDYKETCQHTNQNIAYFFQKL